MENNNWSSLNIKEKFQYILATMFGVASVVIGFLAFIYLMEVPWNVTGISALWASICCGIVGMSLHFKSQMMEFDTEVKQRLNDIDNVLGKLQNDGNESQMKE